MGFLPHLWPAKIFFQKSGSVTFVTLWCTNFMQKIRKILRAVSEISKDWRTDQQTDQPDRPTDGPTDGQGRLLGTPLGKPAVQKSLIFWKIYLRKRFKVKIDWIQKKWKCSRLKWSICFYDKIKTQATYLHSPNGFRRSSCPLEGSTDGWKTGGEKVTV